MIFENIDTHNPEIDPIVLIDLKIKCSPGQADAIMYFLEGIKSQAGVYYASAYEGIENGEQLLQQADRDDNATD